MAGTHDYWERLVKVTLDREHLRQLARQDSLSSNSSSSSSLGSDSSSPLPRSSSSFYKLSVQATFKKRKLLQATLHFSDENLIKRGQSGDLFMAKFEKYPDPVVVKRIHSAHYDMKHFSVELDFFSRVSSHARFVSLLGKSFEGREKFLVYRYFPKRDLSSFLFVESIDGCESGSSKLQQALDWITRLKIAIGAAEGLAYLHHKCDPPIAHGDVQASSILLDDNFEARLGSLSRSSPQHKDSMFARNNNTGHNDHKATCANDVYCFGKVLLELITGKSGVTSSTDFTLENLWRTTMRYLNDLEFVGKIMDQSLVVNDDLIQEVRSMAYVARSCLNPRPPLRPVMREVLKALENSMNVINELVSQ